ncbi:MAG TPA: hypothetical protein VE960_01900 [bacterium]|nr:hypothetical protein [bacterium]
MSRPAVALLLFLVLSTGCSSRNPSWADAINPCCGQDLVLRGIDPPEDRCADIVLDQETARRLMADVASGSGMTHWHVRFIPGGPACIWQEWPGLTEKEFREVELPAEPEDDREKTRPDSTAATAQETPH